MNTTCQHVPTISYDSRFNANISCSLFNASHLSFYTLSEYRITVAIKLRGHKYIAITCFYQSGVIFHYTN